MSGFSFGGGGGSGGGAAAAGGGGFSFGGGGSAPKPAPAFGGGGGAFGGSGTKATAPVLSFGGGGGGGDKPAGLSFGAAGEKPAAGAGGFGFNKPVPKTDSAGEAAKSTSADLVVGTSFGGGFGMKPAEQKDATAPTAGAKPSFGAGAKPTFGSTAASSDAKPSFGAPTAGAKPSFGATPSATPAAPSTALTASATPATTAPATGFGFGTNTAVATTTTTPAAGGFSLTTTATPAAGAGAGIGAGALTTTPGAGAGAAPGASSKDTLNLFSKKTLQEVVNKWKCELEEDVLNYQKQAERVKKWDEQLRENQRVMNDLVDTVHRLYIDQDDLADNIQQISEFQDDLDMDLNELSEQVDKELEKMGDLQPDEALYMREQIYTRASDLDHHLTQMHSNLESIVTDFNEARGGGEDSAEALDGSSDISKILKVLNVHNDSLSFIEAKSRQLKHDADALSRQMVNMYSNSSAMSAGSYQRGRNY